MKGLPLSGPQIHPLPAPEKKPTGYISDFIIADPDKGIYYWIPNKYEKVSELVAIKNDADRRRELREARDMAASEVSIYGNMTRGKKKEHKKKKRIFLTDKKISKFYYKNIDAYIEAERLI